MFQARGNAEVMARRVIARASDLLTEELMFFLKPGNDVELLECVGMGSQNFRINFTRRMWDKHQLRINDNVAEAVFFAMSEQVALRFDKPAAAMLDTVEDVTPPTPAEIIEDWKVDVQMDDDARRALYGRDGSSQRELEIAKGEMRDELRSGESGE